MIRRRRRCGASKQGMTKESSGIEIRVRVCCLSNGEAFAQLLISGTPSAACTLSLFGGFGSSVCVHPLRCTSSWNADIARATLTAVSLNSVPQIQFGAFSPYTPTRASAVPTSMCTYKLCKRSQWLPELIAWETKLRFTCAAVSSARARHRMPDLLRAQMYQGRASHNGTLPATAAGYNVSCRD